MKAGIYLGKEKIEIRELPLPEADDNDVLIQNLYSSICGTIGIAAAVAFSYFGMNKIMVCDHSDFRLKLAEKLGFAICNPSKENFADKAKDYFGTAPSLSGETADIDCCI